MSGTKHTPGPWRLAGKATVRHDSGNGGWIADVHWKNREANARLIVAAPELVAACEAVSAHYSGSLDHQPPFVALARAAIAKALGSAA